MAQLSCYFSKTHHIIACSDPLSHMHFSQQLHMKDDQIGWTRHLHNFAYAALIQQQLHLNPTSYLKPGHSGQVYSNQKEIEYISASNITATVETHPPQLHFMGLFPRVPRDSAIHVHVLFLVHYTWNTLLHIVSP